MRKSKTKATLSAAERARRHRARRAKGLISVQIEVNEALLNEIMADWFPDGTSPADACSKLCRYGMMSMRSDTGTVSEISGVTPFKKRKKS